eukprot:RCo011920
MSRGTSRCVWKGSGKGCKGFGDWFVRCVYAILVSFETPKEGGTKGNVFTILQAARLPDVLCCDPILAPLHYQPPPQIFAQCVVFSQSRFSTGAFHSLLASF